MLFLAWCCCCSSDPISTCCLLVQVIRQGLSMVANVLGPVAMRQLLAKLQGACRMGEGAYLQALDIEESLEEPDNLSAAQLEALYEVILDLTLTASTLSANKSSSVQTTTLLLASTGCTGQALHCRSHYASARPASLKTPQPWLTERVT